MKKILTFSLGFILASFSLSMAAQAHVFNYPGAAPCDTTLQACIDAAQDGDFVVTADNISIVENPNLGSHSITLLSASGYAEMVAAGQTCANGLVDAGEECDDDNTADGDGCSATCKIEAGYTCQGTAPSQCTKNPDPGQNNSGGSSGCSLNQNSSPNSPFHAVSFLSLFLAAGAVLVRRKIQVNP